MCGIVGLFAKSPEIEQDLGRHVAAMLEQMSDRGPDSAGVAIYREPVAAGSSKLVLQHPDLSHDWEALAADLAGAFGGEPSLERRGNHAVLVVSAEAGESEPFVRAKQVASGSSALPPKIDAASNA